MGQWVPDAFSLRPPGGGLRSWHAFCSAYHENPWRERGGGGVRVSRQTVRGTGAGGQTPEEPRTDRRVRCKEVEMDKETLRALIVQIVFWSLALIAAFSVAFA